MSANIEYNSMGTSNFTYHSVSQLQSIINTKFHRWCIET